MKVVTTIPLTVLSCALAWGQAAPPAKAPASPKPAASKPAAAKPAAPKPAAPKPAPAKPANPADPVVISAAGETVTKSQFEGFLSRLPEQQRSAVLSQGKRQLAEQMAGMKALVAEARKRHIDQRPDIRAEMAFQADSLLAGTLYQELGRGTSVDEAAVKAAYDQNKGKYEQVKARHILIRYQGSRVPARAGQKELTEQEALAKAEAVRKRLEAGEDFAKVAEAESDDSGSAKNGGELGTFGHGQMVQEFDQAAFGTPVGQISQPVKTPFGYHIIKVEERTSKSFDDVRPQLENTLRQQAAQKAAEDIKKQANVQIDDTYFGKQ